MYIGITKSYRKLSKVKNLSTGFKQMHEICHFSKYIREMNFSLAEVPNSWPFFTAHLEEDCLGYSAIFGMGA